MKNALLDWVLEWAHAIIYVAISFTIIIIIPLLLSKYGRTLLKGWINNLWEHIRSK